MSISTRDNFTSPKFREKMLLSEDRSKIILAPRCYVEEQARVLDSFMLDSYKIFKSLTKRLNHFLLYSKLQQPLCLDKIDQITKLPKKNSYKKIKVAKRFLHMH